MIPVPRRTSYIDRSGSKPLGVIQSLADPVRTALRSKNPRNASSVRWPFPTRCVRSDRISPRRVDDLGTQHCWAPSSEFLRGQVAYRNLRSPRCCFPRSFTSCCVPKAVCTGNAIELASNFQRSRRVEKKTLPSVRRLFKDRTYRIQGQAAVPQHRRLKAVNDPPAA